MALYGDKVQTFDGSLNLNYWIHENFMDQKKS